MRKPRERDPFDAAFAVPHRRPQRRRAGARPFPRRRVSSASSPPILHPASIFLDMSGEEIRGRLFLTAGAARRGAVPPARIHDPRLPRLSRLGQGGRGRRIFLSRTGLPGPGRPGRRATADRPRKLWPQGRRGGRRGDLLAVHGGGGGGGGGKLAARLGDAGLFDALLTALALPEVWRRRLKRGLAQGRDLATILDRHGRARSPSPACWPRWRAPTMPGPARWSRTCWRSPASRPSAAAPRARSPTGFSSRRRSGRATRSEPRNGRCSKPISPCPAIRTSPPTSCDDLAARRGSTSAGRSTPSSCATASSPRAAWRSRTPAFRPPSCAISTITPASCSRRATPPDADARPALAGGRYDGLARKLGASEDIPAVGAAITLDRLPAGGAG